MWLKPTKFSPGIEKKKYANRATQTLNKMFYKNGTIETLITWMENKNRSFFEVFGECLIFQIVFKRYLSPKICCYAKIVVLQTKKVFISV